MAKRLLVLFGHGARDPRWAQPFERLRALAGERAPDAEVALAFLEFMSPTLPDCVRTAVGNGCTDVTVVPIFFGQGGHVLRDLPAMVDALRAEFPQLSLRVIDAVGESPAVLAAVADYCVERLG